jgi:precorrin-4/cobalt-precorrin-4 C11-methyltransferase
MTVHFIGAGPGAADLLTLRAARLIGACPVCVYAGALVPPEVLEHAPEGARLVDTQHLDLDEIVAELQAAHERGQDVARLHSGDLSIYSAAAEQMHRLDELGIPWDVTPGVPAFAAAAAALGQELTLPRVAQTVILTRYARRATPMPEGEQLAGLAAHGATLVIHLGAQAMQELVAELLPHYGPDCPVAVVAWASWPEERVLRGTLDTIAGEVEQAGVKRTAVILVGPALEPHGPVSRSHLYSAERERRTHVSPKPSLLLLGGTAEARELAAALAAQNIETITSLAGRVQRPRLPAGQTRIGGFGGPDALAAWLTENGIEAVIDATHPFAERISASAAQAAPAAGVDLLRLERPGWAERPGDRWHWVDGLGAAAALLPRLGKRVLLTTGRQGLAAFASTSDAWFLIRCVDPPDPPLPPDSEVVLDRGPYTLEGELSLIDDHAIDVVATKDSGGDHTIAKLDAARERGLPVVLVRRPARPDTPTVTTVDEAVAWATARVYAG